MAITFRIVSHRFRTDVECDPPLPSHLERLCAETVLTLNDAMCDYYARPKSNGGCGFLERGRPVPKCPNWKVPKARMCSDHHAECPTWANSGECGKNAQYMKDNCPESCKEKGYDAPPPPPPPAKKKKKKKGKKKAADAADKDEV